MTSKTKDGKRVTNLTYCKRAEVYIGLIEMSPGDFRSGMWDKEKKHIKRTYPNLSLDDNG